MGCLEQGLKYAHKYRHDRHADDGSDDKLLGECLAGNDKHSHVKHPDRNTGRKSEGIEQQRRYTGNASHHNLFGKDKGRISE
jgi:hypothetical protein